MMKLDEFQATARRVSLETAADAIQVDIEAFPSNAVAVWLYANDSLFLSETISGFHLMIDRSEWNSETRAEMEKRIYLQWYITEHISDHTKADCDYALKEIDAFLKEGQSLGDAADLVQTAEFFIARKRETESK